MSIRESELDWYKKHGKYKERITKDANNNPYVIGDFSWNAGNKDRIEFVEPKMSFVI